MGHRDEGDALRVEELDQFGEVGERTGQAVDLVDDDDVELIQPNGVEKPLQSRTLETAAGEAAIVVVIANQRPALARLALDIGFAGFPLSVERVEVLFEPVIGRDARVDRAAADLVGLASALRSGRARLMARSPSQRDRQRSVAELDSACLARIPKKRGPFQRVPVIAWATFDKLGYVAPFQTKPSSTTVT